MALAKDTPLATLEGVYTDHPVATGAKIYEGAIVAINAAGFARPFVSASGDIFFAGVCEKQADATGLADGAITVKVRRDNHYRTVMLTGAVQADIGDVIHASADDAFTKTALNNLVVGKIHAFLGSDKVVVKLEPNV